MNDRRITPAMLDKGRPHNMLKQIAGLLTSLSYRDMQKLAETFDVKNGTGRTTAERLLAVADEILSEPEEPAKVVMR